MKPTISHTCLTHDDDDSLYEIDHLVEEGNKWLEINTLHSFECYAQGHIKYLIEYMAPGGNGVTNIVEVYRANPMDSEWFRGAIMPSERNPDKDKISCIPPTFQKGRIIDLVRNHFGRNFAAICYWGRDSMLIDNIEVVDHVEYLVPSRAIMRSQEFKIPKEFRTDLMGESDLKGYVKRIGTFGERELNRFNMSGVCGTGKDNLEVGIVKRGPEMVDNLTQDNFCFSRDCFVLFGKGGALAGLCICSDNKAEGRFIAEQFVKIRDAFRCPLYS